MYWSFVVLSKIVMGGKFLKVDEEKGRKCEESLVFEETRCESTKLLFAT